MWELELKRVPECTVLLHFVLQSEGISNTGEMWQQALLSGTPNSLLFIYLFIQIH